MNPGSSTESDPAFDLEWPRGHDSGPLTVDDPATTLSSDVTGATFLRLVVTDGGNGTDSDHADWAGPALVCS